MSQTTEGANGFKGVIRAVRVTNKGHLKVTFIDNETHGEKPANYTHPGVTGDRPVHEDLLKSLSVLKGHAASWGELKSGPVDQKYIKTRECNIDPALKSYEVVGFTYKGAVEEDKTVTLRVKRKLSKGGHYEFDLPSIRLYNKTVGGYEFSGNLVNDLDDCEIEIAEYMNGKFADNGQLSLALSVDDEGELQEEESEL